MFKSTKIVVTLMAALAVLIGTVSATYYFFGGESFKYCRYCAIK